MGTKTVHCKGGNEERYDTWLKENRLLFIADAIKEALNEAYKETYWHRMANKIDFIIDEYFFLKIMDASRNTYTRDHKSHKFLP